MRKAFEHFINMLIPFLGLGIFIVLLFTGIIIFSYLLVFGAIAGLILFVIFWIYNKLTSKTKPSGRVIDHDKIQK